MISISKKGLTEDVNKGMKAEEIIAKYSTPDVPLKKSELKRLLTEAGLKIKKTSKKFNLVDDLNTTTAPTTVLNN